MNAHTNSVLNDDMDTRSLAARRRTTLNRVAWASYAGAVLMLVLHAVGWVLAAEDAHALYPPAGRTIAAQTPMRFVVLGDNRGNMSVFEQVLCYVKADCPSLVLHTGDLVKKYRRAEFRWVGHELDEEELPMPFCAVPGNHDTADGRGDVAHRLRWYTEAFGPRQYWFAAADSLFVAFDTSVEQCDEEDLRWLDGTLSELRSQYRNCFVFTHEPPRDPRPDHGHALDAEDGARLVAVLKKHDVSALFAGHIHGYYEDNIDGLPIYITGGAGAELKVPSARYHYLLCTVEADGSLIVQKKDVPGCPNSDYPEYVLRVQLLPRAFLIAAGLFALVGMASGLGGTRVRRG